MPVWTIIDLAYVQGVQELNIFNKHTARLKMANIAQVVNVLQAMILTKGPQMLLTPTYHVFRMYSVHQNATYVPAEYDCERLVSEEGRIMDKFSASASRDASGVLHVSLANPVLDKPVTGEILTAPDVHAFNDFGKEPAVKPVAFTGAKVSGGKVKVTLPAASSPGRPMAKPGRRLSITSASGCTSLASGRP